MTKESQAYLEYHGRRVELESPFKLGRSKNCAFLLDEPQASREHAMIVLDTQAGHWLLTDLASTNGTYHNGRRLIGTKRLKANDTFSIGAQEFIFRMPSGNASSRPTMTAPTLVAIERHAYWLILADIKNSTRFSQELPPGEASLKIRQWIDECRPPLDRAHCDINEYLGDGFLAVCREHRTTPEAVATLVKEFAELNSATGLNFRVVVHFGELQSGVAVSSGVEKLSGVAMNYVFKCEKAVSKFNARTNLTEAAFKKLGAPAALSKMGEVPVSGFDGGHAFYGWTGLAGVQTKP